MVKIFKKSKLQLNGIEQNFVNEAIFKLNFRLTNQISNKEFFL